MVLSGGLICTHCCRRSERTESGVFIPFVMNHSPKALLLQSVVIGSFCNGLKSVFIELS